MRKTRLILFLFLIMGLVTTVANGVDLDFAVKLKTGELNPTPIRQISSTAQALVGKHIIIQFDHALTDNEKANLASQGIELLQYIPNYAFTARLNKTLNQSDIDQHSIRWFSDIKPEQKLSPMITETGIGEWAYRGDNKVEFAVVLHKDEDLSYWSDKFTTDFDAVILGTVPSVGVIELIVDEPFYFRLADLDAVVWIEPAMPEPEEHNNKARANTGAEIVQAAPFNLSGAGVTVAEWDGGRADKFHTDFGNRLFTLDGSAISTHATHVAGTVIGDGFASNGLYRGMAPGARLLSQLWWGSSSELTSEYSEVINGWDATIATNSWGYGVGNPASISACENTLGNYTSQTAAIDEIVRGSQGAPINIFWSAGNQRSGSSDQCGSLGYTYGTIGLLSTAKNIVTVGALNSATSTMTSFSSWGPTDDGRLKPDVVGPGCLVNSTKPNSGYTGMCGTSMSCPATAGVAALLREQWESYIGIGELWPSTLKGIMINTADDLGNTGPDFSFGHGRVDAVEAATKISIGTPSYVQDSISTGAQDSYDLTVLGSTEKLKVTLVWSDPGGSASASQNLINDLDLVLIDPFSNQELPWILDHNNPSLDATKGEDHLNNIETVEIDNPTAGIWTAVVKGTNIPTGPQTYSLIFTPDSSHTPGSQVAVAAYNGADVNDDPGTTVSVDFWASNVGANIDSLHVQISDDVLWLQSTIDTVVTLNPFDSAHFTLLADIPALALSGEQANVTMSVTSLTNSLSTDQTTVSVITNTTYAVQVQQLTNDTIQSPDSYYPVVTVINNGNGTDDILVSISDQMGWFITPNSETVTVGASGDSGQAFFNIFIPAEVPHLSTNTFTVIARTGGLPEDTTTFDLVADNAVFPPQLISPDTVTYTQERLQTFNWVDDGSDSYTLLIASDTAFNSLVQTYTGLTTGSFTMPGGDELTDGRYYWGVKKFVGGDSSSLQLAPFEITVDNAVPVPVIANNPEDGSYESQLYFNFTFSDSVGGNKPQSFSAPEFVYIQVSQDPGFSVGLYEYDLVPGTSFQIPDSLAEGRWYWHLKRFDLAGNETNYSSTNSFVLDTQTPPIPTLLIPTDGDMIGDDPLEIVWQGDLPPAHEEAPEYYFLHVSDLENFGDFETFFSFVYDTTVSLTSLDLELGRTYWWRARTFDSAGYASEYSQPFSFEYRTFICGDLDSNENPNPDIGDLTYLISFLFLDGPPPEPFLSGSVNCDTEVDIADITALIDFLFITGSDLCCL